MNEDMDYHQIITQLRSFNLAETFPEIRRKAEQIGNWSLTEDVERQWTTYQQMLQFCDRAYVTKVHATPKSDTFFPNLDEDSEWKVTAESDEQSYFDTTYAFVKYERV